MHRLIYHSMSALPAGGALVGDLGLLLEECLAANPARRITGVLAFHDGRFLQLIEGPDDAVDRLYAAIRRDRRHDHVELVLHEPCERRAFGSWSMALAYRDPRLRSVFRTVRQGSHDAALRVVRDLVAIVA